MTMAKGTIGTMSSMLAACALAGGAPGAKRAQFDPMAPHKWAERFVDFKGTRVPGAFGGEACTEKDFNDSYCHEGPAGLSEFKRCSITSRLLSPEPERRQSRSSRTTPRPRALPSMQAI